MDKSSCWNEYVCPVCGKRFLVTYLEGWTYKKTYGNYGTIKFCSYTCRCKFEKDPSLYKESIKKIKSIEKKGSKTK